MYNIEKIPGRSFTIDNIAMLWFGGTSYLGIPYNTHFQSLVKNGIDNYGGNWGSSRNNPVKLNIYETAELFLANFTNAPAALTVSSGMLAGQILLKYLDANDNKIIYAPKVHPALWGNNYTSNKELFNTFTANINTTIAKHPNQTITIVADAVSSPHIESYDFSWTANLPNDKVINIVIDDSHSLGVIGETGQGIYDSIITKSNVNLYIVASLNKALGVLGGVIIGQSEHLNNIKNNPFFAGCSPMSPAYAFACSNAKLIYNEQLAILRKNCLYFNSKIKGQIHFNNVNNHPAYCFPQEGLAEFLLTKQILIPNFAYPNPNDSKITRLVISSLHTIADLDYLANSILEFNLSHK